MTECKQCRTVRSSLIWVCTVCLGISICILKIPYCILPQSAGGRQDEYFLYGCFLEASMIERKVGDKPVHFEISIGK